MKELKYYQRLRYPIRIEPDPEGGYLASHPDLPGCNAFGETIQAAVKSLDESRDMWLESYFEIHGEAPEPSKPRGYSGKLLVRLPKYLHEKLRESADEEGVSLNQYIVTLLAERRERRSRSQSEDMWRMFPVNTSGTFATLHLPKVLPVPLWLKVSAPTYFNFILGETQPGLANMSMVKWFQQETDLEPEIA
jgi:predicted RNase H-like HicB family nuclease